MKGLSACQVNAQRVADNPVTMARLWQKIKLDLCVHSPITLWDKMSYIAHGLTQFGVFSGSMSVGLISNDL